MKKHFLIYLVFILANVHQAFSGQGAISGNVVGVSRKTNSTFQCGTTNSASLIWIKIKRSDNGTSAWYVYDVGEIGRELMSIALTSLTTATPVRVYYDDGGYPSCTGTFKIEELWLSNDGF